MFSSPHDHACIFSSLPLLKQKHSSHTSKSNSKVTSTQRLSSTLFSQSISIMPSLKVKVVQLCLALCNPMDCPWNSPGQNIRVGSLLLLQGIFPSQGSNQGLRIVGGFFTAEPQGKTEYTGVGNLSLLQQIFLTQELNCGLLHCRQILYHLSSVITPCP